MEILIHILTHNLIPIFVMIGTGILLGRKFDLHIQTLSKLNIYAFMPTFTFVAIYTSDLSVNIGTTLIFLAVYLLINTAIAYTAAGIMRMKGNKKYVLLNSVIMYNTGNIGIPLITLIFAGSPYLNQALVIQITVMLSQVVIGSTLGFYNAGRGAMHWKDSIISVIKLPTIYAIIAAIILKKFNYDFTQNFVWPAFIYTKQAMIGFVLITLGVQLSATKPGKGDSEVAVVVALRLLAGPAAAFLLLKLAGIQGILAQVLFISSAAPTAVTSALISIERNCEPEFAAKVVMYSTLFCALTFIFVVYFSRILFPV